MRQQVRTGFAILCAVVCVAAGARMRAVQHPPPESLVQNRGTVERSGVFPGQGPRAVTGIAWQTQLVASFSNAVYGGGTIYVPGADGRLDALNATTGTLLWRSTRLGDFSSPPTINGGVVYVSGSDAHIYALNAANGTVLWSFVEDDWGIGAPLFVGGTIYLGTEAGSVYAIDAQTHTQKWRVAVGGHVHGDLVFCEGLLFVPAERAVVALDPADGREVWRKTRDVPWFSIAASNGVVIGDAADGILFALDSRTGVERWHVTPPADGVYWTAPAILNGVVYSTTDQHEVRAVDLLTGETRWTYSASDAVSAVVIADGVIYAGTFAATQPADDRARKDVFALDAATGAELFRTQVTGQVTSSIAVGGGGIFVVSSAGSVYGIR